MITPYFGLSLVTRSASGWFRAFGEKYFSQYV
jgi:hypothetical protein